MRKSTEDDLSSSAKPSETSPPVGIGGREHKIIADLVRSGDWSIAIERLGPEHRDELIRARSIGDRRARDAELVAHANLFAAARRGEKVRSRIGRLEQHLKATWKPPHNADRASLPNPDVQDRMELTDAMTWLFLGCQMDVANRCHLIEQRRGYMPLWVQCPFDVGWPVLMIGLQSDEFRVFGVPEAGGPEVPIPASYFENTLVAPSLAKRKSLYEPPTDMLEGDILNWGQGGRAMMTLPEVRHLMGQRVLQNLFGSEHQSPVQIHDPILPTTSPKVLLVLDPNVPGLGPQVRP